MFAEMIVSTSSQAAIDKALDSFLPPIAGITYAVLRAILDETTNDVERRSQRSI